MGTVGAPRHCLVALQVSLDDPAALRPWHTSSILGQVIYLDDFTHALHAARRAPGTVQQRLGDLRRYSAATGIDPLKASTKDLREYLGRGAQELHWAPEYMKRIRASFRVFYAWAHASGLRDDNPALALASIAIPKGAHTRQPAPEPVVRRAHLIAPTLRVRLIITLAATLGLRRSEIAALRLSNRDGDQIIVSGKGARTRVLALDAYTRHLLEEREREIAWAEFYFPGRVAGHAHPATIAKWARPYLDGNGLHSLRHRAATQGYRSTHDVRAVQTFLGHSSLETTQRYVDHDPASLQLVVDATTLGDGPSTHSTSTQLDELLTQVRRLGQQLRAHGLSVTLTPLPEPGDGEIPQR